MGGYFIRNSETKEVYASGLKLSQCRAFCDQRLLRASGSREEILSDIAAGFISVYDATHTEYRGAGF